MKIINISIKIVDDKPKKIESNYLSSKNDFLYRLSQLPELIQ